MNRSAVAPLLDGATPAALADREIGWEAYGMDAYRRGHWKILRLPEPYGNSHWQLYDLTNDLGETNDVAVEHPELVRELAEAWERYAAASGVITPSEPVAYAKSVSPGKY